MTVPLHRKALPGASAIVLLAIMTAFPLHGCTSSQAPPFRSKSVASGADAGTPFQSAGPMAPWYKNQPSIPLDTALSRVGAVSLPDTSSAGTVTRASLAPGTHSPDATPSLSVLYSSGVQLFVNAGVVDLQAAADTQAPFMDGRKTIGELRQVDGVAVVVMQPGTQSGSHSYGYRTPAQLLWNADGRNYFMISSNEVQSTDHLLDIMRTMRPATR